MDTQESAAGCVCLWGSAFKECQSAEAPRVPAKSYSLSRANCIASDIMTQLTPGSWSCDQAGVELKARVLLRCYCCLCGYLPLGAVD